MKTCKAPYCKTNIYMYYSELIVQLHGTELNCFQTWKPTGHLLKRFKLHIHVLYPFQLLVGSESSHHLINSTGHILGYRHYLK